MALPKKEIFDIMMTKLENTVDFYETTNHKNKLHLFALSSNANISFEFNEGNIPHLLGVKTAYLKDSKQFDSTKAFDLMKELLKKRNFIYKKCENGILNYHLIFSDYIMQKLEAFKTVLELDFNKLCYVVKYDKISLTAI